MTNNKRLQSLRKLANNTQGNTEPVSADRPSEVVTSMPKELREAWKEALKAEKELQAKKAQQK